MKTTFKYKGFDGSIEFSIEDECLAGEILFINSKIIYVGDNIPELRQAFQDSVDHYLAYCAEKGIEPEKPMSGSFNVRTSPEMHKKLILKSIELDCSLNACVNVALTDFIEQPNRMVESFQQVTKRIVDLNSHLTAAVVTVRRFNTYSSSDYGDEYNAPVLTINETRNTC